MSGATPPPPEFRPRTALGRQYAARVAAILRGVERLEDAALGHVARALERLRADLVELAVRRPAGGLDATATALDVSEIVAAITRLVAAFGARMSSLAIQASMRALDAGALVVDGALRPALAVARQRARVRAPAPETRALVGAGAGVGTFGGGPPDFTGGSGAGGAGGSGGRLPPVTYTPGGDGYGGGPELPTLAVAGVFPVVPDQLRRSVAELTAEEVTSLTTRMRQEMVAGVRRAALGGLTPFEVMKAVDAVLPAAARGARLTTGIGSSAERIVRTQVARASNRATVARADALAAELRAVGATKGAAGLRKQWVATMDSRTRPDHLAAHGQTVGVDEAFVVGGERLDHPGDPSASASNTIQCRCRVVTVLPDDPAALFAR